MRPHLPRTLTAATGFLLLATLLTPTAATADGTAAGKRLTSDHMVIRIDPDPAPPGGETSIHGYVLNEGPDISGGFTTTVRLPAGTEAIGPNWPEDCVVDPLSQERTIRCEFPAGLRAHKSGTALVPFRISPDVPIGTLRGGSVTVSAHNDPNPENDHQPFEVEVIDTPT
ncbi:hypothetical protein ACFCXT_14735 [Streptomyces vinaceus]|uniref:hypothetical protein n=1 Tax=Streptomyces vinaceus TaxID=1960 RepID=UPI0035D5501D